MRTRHLFCFFFAASLVAGTVAQAHGQPPARVKRTLPVTELTDEQLRKAEEADPRLVEESEKFNRQMAREMYDLRQSMTREAMQRMQQRRYEGPREHTVESVLIFFAWMIVLSAVLWLIRTILEQRRWNR